MGQSPRLPDGRGWTDARGLRARTGGESPLPTNPLPTRPAGVSYTVVRGTIEQTVKVTGRVVSAREETIAFSDSGRLSQLHVQPDQTVKQGDLLAELDTRVLENQLKVAKVQAEIAQLKVDQATGKALPGVESSAVTAAQAAVSQAEAAEVAAQRELDQRQAGPSPAELESANAAVISAEAQLEKDQAALTRLQAPPSDPALTILQTSLDQATATLQRAQAAYDRVKSRPDISGLPESAALQAATIGYNRAKAEFDLGTAGPSPDAVASATRQISADQAALRAAQARLDEVRRGASPQELDLARQNLNAARATLDAARAALNQATKVAAGQGIAAQIAQKEATLAQAQVQNLQVQIASRQVRAPFDGIVTGVTAHEGDAVQAALPILTVADPTQPEITATANLTDLPLIAAGQAATITLEGASTLPLAGRVDEIIPNPAAGGSDAGSALGTTSGSQSVARPVIRIGLTHTTHALSLGTPAEVAIVIERKDGALLLPSVAIQVFGGNRFVRTIGADGRSRDLDIQVGISDGARTEVTAGLEEGQEVFAE